MRLSLVLALLMGLFMAATTTVAAPADATLAPVELRCEHEPNPLGIDAAKPRLSWILERMAASGPARGLRQTAYRILVAASEESLNADRGDLWDTGRVESNQTRLIVYSGRPLISQMRCVWKAKVWDQDGHESAWSKPASWSMGLLAADDWKAKWISFQDSSPLHKDRNTLYLPPARQFRKDFVAAKPMKRATLYASALGLVDLYLNGHRASDAMFMPGWSDYRRRAYYRTLDATSLVQSGDNCLGAVVAEGWYSGYVGYGLLCGYGPNKAGRCFYGKTPALLAQLEIEYADGSRETIGTDPTWQVTDKGPVREADLIMGETYDARAEQPDWCKPGFKTGGWEHAIRAEDNGSTRAVFSDNQGDREVELGFQKPARMQAYSAPPVRAVEEIKAVGLTEPKPGEYVFDLGQEFAGVVRLKVQGPAGTKVQLRFGEMLYPDGRLMTENLRRARATDYYILRGDPAGETWTPRFTYHGFRYVELTGLAARPGLDAVTGIVVHSDTSLTSSFECSDPMVNRLFQNIVWTQRANFVELPTDCPQRDERLGWMGDAQIYVRAACYNADVAAFFTKWMDDVEESQRAEGPYPDYAPYPMSHGAPKKSFGTAWMDAGIICPWTIWKVYGDTEIIVRHYDSMKRFLEFRRASSPDFRGVSLGNTWGDWLNMDEPTPIEYIDLCYFAQTVNLMSEMAQAIGRSQDADEYRRLRASINAAFQTQYVNPEGTLKVDTQTAYALALAFGLIPEPLVRPASVRLAEKIAQKDYRMATGFLGTRPLLPVLSATGHHDLAVRLFQSKRLPSWGYEVENGATTVWERWDSYKKGQQGVAHVGMNSYAHYAFGAVCEWMFQTLAGIDSQGTGFQRLLIQPRPAGNFTWVKARYNSPSGPIATSWRRSASEFMLDVAVPPNTTATVVISTDQPDGVKESGHAANQARGVRFVRVDRAAVVYEIGSGEYHFTSPLSSTQDLK